MAIGSWLSRILEDIMSGNLSLKKKEEKLYFVAIVPPSPIYEETLEHKAYFKAKYNSKASLNSPPHITLHMPFRWNEQHEQELASHLKSFADQNPPVTIQLKDFSSFPPRVIFINVVITPELESLQKNLQRYFKRQLNIFNANYKELPFHPHLTLAFRDLKKPNYQKAWDEFVTKNYQATFLANTLALLKHSGSVWEVHKEFTFRPMDLRSP
jgi:2'-5' RNA ligase